MRDRRTGVEYQWPSQENVEAALKLGSNILPKVSIYTWWAGLYWVWSLFASHIQRDCVRRFQTAKFGIWLEI